MHTRQGCPHRDAKTGGGGCVYCFNPAFSGGTKRPLDLPGQIRDGIRTARARGFSGRFLLYFQSETNTRAPIDVLGKWFRQVFDYPEDIAGLCVSTRPDCLDSGILDLLEEIARRSMVWLEIGLQSANDATLRRIRRGHDFACFRDAVASAGGRKGVLPCAHLILGLPGETGEDMLRTVRRVNALPLSGVKLHHLQVVKHTLLARWYREGAVRVFSENEYLDLLASLLPRFRADLVMHRLAGETRNDLLIAPRWSLSKGAFLNALEREMNRRGRFQGDDAV